MKDIAFTINYCLKHKKALPIIFCGAGTSKTAGIPLTGEIIKDVFEKFIKKTKIAELKAKNSTDYYEIMRALRPEERQDLFWEYIESEKVRINLSSLFMAQLLKEKYVDYIYTVNFDDIIIKSSAIFNFIPPIYDLASISTLTSSKFMEQSLVYLHGQYFGQWLLNTPEEIKKGKKNVHNLFQRECHRPWIIVGYSGGDQVFEELLEIESFNSELYWVSHNDLNLNKEVEEKLLKQPNKNAYLVSNIDADTFFLELTRELELPFPPIFEKPFTFLESYFEKIQNFEAPFFEKKELYERLNEQKNISLNWIKKAKDSIENADTLENLQQEIISTINREEFSEEKAIEFEEKINSNKKYENAKEQLGWYYGDWGNALSNLDKQKVDESSYIESFAKYQTASELNPKDNKIFYNWGKALIQLAKIKNNDKDLFVEAEKVFQKGINLGGKVYNYACYFSLQNNKEKALLYLEKSIQNKEISIKHIEYDEDWDNLREEIEYKELIKKYSKD